MRNETVRETEKEKARDSEKAGMSAPALGPFPQLGTHLRQDKRDLPGRIEVAGG
jgi:hypothetical protein